MENENSYRMKVISFEKAVNDQRSTTRAIPADPFDAAYGMHQVLEPPYDMFTLAVMPEFSSELGPAINAMTINIDKTGYRIVPRDNIPRDDESLPPSVREDQSKVSNFFANAVLEPTETFTTLRENLRYDLETTGNAYVEALPSLVSLEPAGLKHLPSWTMRLRKEDEGFTECEVPRAVLENETWVIKSFPYRKRFRRFVQIREDMATVVFFKEWGDPRKISSETGEVIEDGIDFPEEKLATEVIHFKLYCPRSPYGLPRWIGNLFTIFGNRSAETINYMTFKNNQIPAMMLMATNVQLTDGSIERIQKFIEERVQGNNNYSTMVLVEAEPITEGMKDPGVMKLELKELGASQHTDALFVNYMNRNDEKIRRSFRLPPIFTGSTQEYTRATADSSRKVAEEQVFSPERTNEDSIWNQTIIPALGVATCVFRSNSPNITDNYELTQLLAVAERSGGLSPAISRLIVEDVLGRDLPDIASEINPDIPFTLTMLREEINGKMGIPPESTTSPTPTQTDTELLKQFRVLDSMTDGKDSIPLHVRSNIRSTLRMLEEWNGRSIS